MTHVPIIDTSPRPVVTVDQVLSQYVWVFYAAYLVAFIFTPLMRMVALHFGIIDQPDGARKIHRQPVAYLGGVAIFLGWLAGLAVSRSRPLYIDEPGLPQSVIINLWIVGGAALIFLLGLCDDIWSIRPRTKILGQVVAAGLLVAGGIGTHCTTQLVDGINSMLASVHTGHSAPLLLPSLVVTVSSAVVVIIITVGYCNATNLMDGLDGLCGGVTAVTASGFLFLAVHIATSEGAVNPNLDAMRVVLAVSLLGAVVGFVPFNFNPASIFMGDAGSMFLGYCSAVMILLFNQEQHSRWFLAATVMFALPALDTALAFTRRWVNGRPLFSADRHHFHHQLMARGLSVRQVALASYLLALFFVFCGCLMAIVRTRYAVAGYILIFAYIAITAIKMGMVREKPVSSSRRTLAYSDSRVADAPVTSVVAVNSTLPPSFSAAGDASSREKQMDGGPSSVDAAANVPKSD